MRSESHRFQAYRGAEPPRFANRIELECAKILDCYGDPLGVRADPFVLERDAEGRMTRAFTPDFYLPEPGALHRGDGDEAVARDAQEPQAARAAAALPDVKVKLFYRRDIERLAQRYQLKLAS